MSDPEEAWEAAGKSIILSYTTNHNHALIFFYLLLKWNSRSNHRTMWGAAEWPETRWPDCKMVGIDFTVFTIYDEPYTVRWIGDSTLSISLLHFVEWPFLINNDDERVKWSPNTTHSCMAFRSFVFTISSYFRRRWWRSGRNDLLFHRSRRAVPKDGSFTYRSGDFAGWDHYLFAVDDISFPNHDVRINKAILFSVFSNTKSDTRWDLVFYRRTKGDATSSCTDVHDTIDASNIVANAFHCLDSESR